MQSAKAGSWLLVMRVWQGAGREGLPEGLSGVHYLGCGGGFACVNLGQDSLVTH